MCKVIRCLLCCMTHYWATRSLRNYRTILSANFFFCFLHLPPLYVNSHLKQGCTDCFWRTWAMAKDVDCNHMHRVSFLHSVHRCFTCGYRCLPPGTVLRSLALYIYSLMSAWNPGQWVESLLQFSRGLVPLKWPDLAPPCKSLSTWSFIYDASLNMQRTITWVWWLEPFIILMVPSHEPVQHNYRAVSPRAVEIIISAIASWQLHYLACGLSPWR